MQSRTAAWLGSVSQEDGSLRPPALKQASEERDTVSRGPRAQDQDSEFRAGVMQAGSPGRVWNPDGKFPKTDFAFPLSAGTKGSRCLQPETLGREAGDPSGAVSVFPHSRTTVLGPRLMPEAAVSHTLFMEGAAAQSSARPEAGASAGHAVAPE